MRQMTVRRGEMNEKIVIKAVNPTSDGQGGSTEGALTTVCTMWAKVSPFSANRTLQYGQITGSQTYEITMNYRDDITISATNIIEWNSKTLAVHSVRQTDENRKQYIILAYEKV